MFVVKQMKTINYKSDENENSPENKLLQPVIEVALIATKHLFQMLFIFQLYAANVSSIALDFLLVFILVFFYCWVVI